MVVNEQRKFIFLHIPKNAGGSVTTVLPGVNHPYTHANARFIEHNFNGDWFVFTFVRNPWERLLSLYTFVVERREQEPVGFKKWLLEGEMQAAWDEKYEQNKLPPHQRRTQLSYLRGDRGLITPFVGKVETLNEDLERICDMIRVPFVKPNNTCHKTDHADYRMVYDDEMIEFVNHYHKEDIEFFGYRF